MLQGGYGFKLLLYFHNPGGHRFKLLSCYREDIPENVIQQHRYQIIRWLDDREAKSEETVTLAQFCDMLMNKPGVSREDAIRVCFLNFQSESIYT
jgi:hypothetical protein